MKVPKKFKEIYELIESGELGIAIKKLATYTQEQSYSDELILLASRLNNLTRNTNLGLVPKNEILIEKNKIAQSVIYYLRQLIESEAKLKTPRPHAVTDTNLDISTDIENIYQLLATNQMQKAFQELMKRIKKKGKEKLKNKLEKLWKKYQQLEQEKRLGIIFEDEFITKNSKITYKMIQILRKMN